MKSALDARAGVVYFMERVDGPRRTFKSGGSRRLPPPAAVPYCFPKLYPAEVELAAERSATGRAGGREIVDR